MHGVRIWLQLAVSSNLCERSAMTIEPTPLKDLVAVDINANETPEPCSYCPNWRFEWIDLPGGGSVLREWHLPECTEVRLKLALNLDEEDE
jgi:hypothetical protein